MTHCIFCDIAGRRPPCHQIWEDEKHLAFLSIFPNTEGFSVVITNQHRPSYAFDLPDQVLADLVLAAKRVDILLDRKLEDVGRTGMILEGFAVNHAHAKLFPMHGTKMPKWRPLNRPWTSTSTATRATSRPTTTGARTMPDLPRSRRGSEARPMTRIILTRHGHVEWHAPERFRGRADLPLTEHGVEQARAASRRIGATWRVAAVYTSPMTRSVHTAQIIAEPLRLHAQAMDAMTDIDYGEWQGLTPDEARARWPKEADLWYRRPDLVRIPGGDSLQDVLARVAHALRVVVDRHPEEAVVLVGHDSVNRVILLHALELPLSRYWLLAQTPCAINEMIATGDGFLVRSINDACHLAAS